MNVIEKLRQALAAFIAPHMPVENRNQTTDEPYGPDIGGTMTSEVGQSYGAYQQTYAHVAWVHMAVSVLSSTLASVPFKVAHKESGEEFPDHLILRMLSAPNPHDIGANFVGLTRTFLELTGNAYWLIVKDQAGTPINLYALDSSRMEPIPDPVVKVKGYSYHLLDGQVQNYDPSEIVHLKYPNPNNPMMGVGRIEAARRAITLDIQAEEFNTAFFTNNAIPSALLVPEEPLSNTQLNRVRRMLQREFKGVQNQHGIGIIGANMKLEKIGINAKDMEFLKQQSFSRDKIGSMFHVPPVYMGNFSEASYANADAQRKMLWEANHIPWLIWFCQYLNHMLVPRIDPEVVVTFDRSFIIPLVESFKTLTKSLSDLRQSGYITTNEGRALIGMPPLEEHGDIVLIPGQFRPLEKAVTSEPEPVAPSPEDSQPGDNDPDDAADDPDEDDESDGETEEERLFTQSLIETFDKSPSTTFGEHYDET